MSSTVSQLFIGYAHASCTTNQVKDAFENALNEEGIVERVDFREKQNDRGETFFCYFIHFARENRQLQHMQAEIAKHGFVVLTYDRVWDRRQSKYVDRYWKVLPYVKKEAPTEAKFVPRLMSLEEASAAGIAAPKKKAAALCEAEPSGGKPLHPNLAKKVAEHQPLTNLEMAQVIQSKPLPLTTEQLFASNLDWDSDSKVEEELPPIPPKPPVLRRSPSTAKEYGMPTPSKRRRSTSQDPTNAFAALTLAENDEEEACKADGNIDFGEPVNA